MAWNNPFAPERVLRTIELAGLAPGARVLDVGCGTGELLAALADRELVLAGLDVDEASITQARASVPDATLTVTEAEHYEPDARFDLVICLGATHAFGRGDLALENALPALARWVREDGWLLVGEGMHMAPIPPAYEAFLGGRAGIGRTHRENVATFEAGGWDVRHALTASIEEWDAFEWAYYRRKGDRDWRDAYLRWGRGVIGFGLYLAR